MSDKDANPKAPCVGTVEPAGLSKNNAAKFLGISTRMIDRLIADQTSGFPYAKIGSRVVVVVEPAKKWLIDKSIAQVNGDKR